MSFLSRRTKADHAPLKTKHLTSSQGDAFADIEKDYKKHLTNKRVKVCQKKRKEGVESDHYSQQFLAGLFQGRRVDRKKALGTGPETRGRMTGVVGGGVKMCV